MEDNKKFDLSSIEKSPKKINFTDYKFALYSALFYALGLFIGSYFYKLVNSETLDNIVKIKEGTFASLFLFDFCLYFSIFLLSAFLGFCLIGKPVIYLIPVFIGIATGMKLAYYFINYSTKGIGYSLIMIIPYIALFITVISYTINTSNELSSSLMKMIKGEGDNKIELPPYLKKYLIYFVAIIFVTLLDSGLTKLLFSVVTI